MRHIRFLLFLLVGSLHIIIVQAQEVIWAPEGTGVISFEDGNISQVDLNARSATALLSAQMLTPQTQDKPLNVQSLEYSKDRQNILLFANTAKVWRKNTRGDYWLFNTSTKKITQVGKGLPAQSLMFAKFSPEGQNVAYVSGHNIYVENLATGKTKMLTKDGTRKLINGTFDWAYEEEFGCRDGFRWSPDGRQIAFWRVDATKIGDYDMINTTDSAYSKVIPVEYPKVGYPPSPVKIGVVNISDGKTTWMKFDGDPARHYITRMEWTGVNQLMVQRLDRKQQNSRLLYCNTANGTSTVLWNDHDDAWVDLNATDIFGEPGGFNFINQGNNFLWISEKDGWRHIYKISKDGKTELLLTPGNYDVASLLQTDEPNGFAYFMASPDNATQSYLYRVKINNPGAPELVSQAGLKGVHTYKISPSAKIALHEFSNHNTPPVYEWVSLPDHKPLYNDQSIEKRIKTDPDVNVEYIKGSTADQIPLDAWIRYPKNFDPNKKYPIIFNVYGEPAASTVMDSYGSHKSFLYNGDADADGYIQASVDNRGTPMLKGREWRKSIYRKIGVLNIKDFAEGAKAIIDKPFVDKDRVAVWGWSGGGSSTLNLLFKYPGLFKTGIAIAAVTNQLFYDNIYQERYMGLPQENPDDFKKGSPAFNVEGLKGNLLYIHGTGDDNVHYDNAEFLINELVKYNKQFQFMAYPNRSHSIREGEGTSQHLSTLFTNYLQQHCPPGAK